jgi:ABC-type phosphate/phosphonate transport system substrate-binding protein
MGKALSRFSGVLFVKADSPVRKIGDIKGKSFMCVKKSSFGGGQMVFRHLIENGLNPFKETTLMEGRKHDNVVMAVQSGMVDVGTVRSDTLERMEEEGKIKLSDFRLIDKSEDDFPFIHTTQLYPEMLVITLPHVSQEINTKVKTALLSFKTGDPALQKAKIAGWTEPLDYGPVAKTLIINVLNGLQ